MHVYTQLGDRSSYVEVCPILDPAPTSSGDYTQPVRVERSLTLQTRNLPEPVSWRKVGHGGTLCNAVSLPVHCRWMALSMCACWVGPLFQLPTMQLMEVLCAQFWKMR